MVTDAAQEDLEYLLTMSREEIEEKGRREGGALADRHIMLREYWLAKISELEEPPIFYGLAVKYSTLIERVNDRSITWRPLETPAPRKPTRGAGRKV